VADSGGQGKKRGRGKKSEDQALLIRALNHRLRREILRLLEDSEKPVSPVKMAKKLGKHLTNVSYHVGVLHRLGVVQEVTQEQVRGALEHFYASAVKGNPPIQALLEETKEADEASGRRKR
jgi:DNA-binding transcriptional ArsR family regulator